MAIFSLRKLWALNISKNSSNTAFLLKINRMVKFSYMYSSIGINKKNTNKEY